MVTEVPGDLVRLADVVKQYPPSRTWWSAKINAGTQAGGIRAYRVPGQRGLWLSQADVERFMRPQQYQPGAREA